MQLFSSLSDAALLRLEERLDERLHRAIIKALAPSLTPRSPHMSKMSHSDLLDITSAVSVTLARCYVDPSTLSGIPFTPYNWRPLLLHKDVTEDEASDGHPTEFGSESAPAAVSSRAIPLFREPATRTALGSFAAVLPDASAALVACTGTAAWPCSEQPQSLRSEGGAGLHLHPARVSSHHAVTRGPAISSEDAIFKLVTVVFDAAHAPQS